jgi:integrase
MWAAHNSAGRSSIDKTVCRELARELGHAQLNQIPALALQGLVLRWKQKLNPWTAHGKTNALKRLLRTIGSITAQTTPPLPKTHKGERRRRIATPDELEKIWRVAGPALRFCLLAWTELGLRFAEPLSVTPADYNQDAQTLLVQTKGGKLRTLPVTPNLAAAIAQALPPPIGEEHTPIVSILNRRTYRGEYAKHAYDFIRHQWYAALKSADVGRDLHPHDLRRTMATQLYRQTLDAVAVQQALGHDDLSTTSHYLKPHEPEKMRELLAQLHWTWTPKKGEPVQ